MNINTQQQLKDLESRKVVIEREICEINSQIVLIQPNYFCPSHDSTTISMIASYEAQRQSLLYQLYDIRTQIDELRNKN